MSGLIGSARFDTARRVAAGRQGSVATMSATFSEMLGGLMANRHLTRRALSRASGRAESTINLLLEGTLEPSAEIIQDIAPALEIAVVDLLVIAGLPRHYDTERTGPWRATGEVGSLVAAASWLSPEQVEQVTALARQLKAATSETSTD